MSVNDSNFDDDYIGFIFGAANQSSLYVAQWKKRDRSPVSLDAETTRPFPRAVLVFEFCCRRVPTVAYSPTTPLLVLA